MDDPKIQKRIYTIFLMKVCRRAHFNSAHRLYRPDWSDDKNNEVFGKCNNPNFHGHNYQLEVWVEGKIDPETGFVIDLKILKSFGNHKKSDCELRYFVSRMMHILTKILFSFSDFYEHLI